MSDHPEFPQESPAMKYLVDQVSKIEDAQACGVGYYKSLGKVLARMDKTDTALVQLQETTRDLKKVMNSDTIAFVLGQKSDEINNTLQKSLDTINIENVKTVSSSLATIDYRSKQTTDGFVRLMNEISTTNKKLALQIAAVDNCLVIPSWKAWAYAVALILCGVLIGWALR